jgi:hypothetical protein
MLGLAAASFLLGLLSYIANPSYNPAFDFGLALVFLGLGLRVKDDRTT